MQKNDSVFIGTFSKIFGTTDLVLSLSVDFYEEYLETEFVFVEIDKIQVPFHISKGGIKQKGNKSLLLSFIEVRSEKDALNLVGKKVSISEIAHITDSEDFGFNSIIDFEIFDQTLGFCGKISDYIDIPSNPLIEITINSEIKYIPANTELILSISEEEGRVYVNLPEGLLDINS